jgi:parvulin-like peptidyl-prolyl isomerase
MRLAGLIAIAVVVLATNVGKVNGGEAPKAVATVNGVALTEADLAEEVNKILPTESSFHSGVTPERMKAIRAKARVALVEMELQYQDALTKGQKLGDAELDAEIDKIKERFKAKGSFDKLIASAGFTESSFRRFVERRILSERFKVRMVDEKAQVAEAQVKEFYETNKARYFKPVEFRASHILLKVDPASTEEQKAKIREKADTILKQLRGGAVFAEIAEKESNDRSSINGGDIGSFHGGETVPEFEKALEALKVGEMSDVVETLYGFHIIKLTDRKEPRQLSYEEMKEKIRAQLTDTEKDRLFKKWMDELRAKAKISYPEEG